MSDLRDIASAFEALGRWLKAIAMHVSENDGHLTQLRENVHAANNGLQRVSLQGEEAAIVLARLDERLGRIENQIQLLHDNMVEGFRRQGVRIEKAEKRSDGQRLPETR
jgi:uncharacterized protein YacL (UPF0231 family)